MIEGRVCENGSYTPPVMYLRFNHRGTEVTEKKEKTFCMGKDKKGGEKERKGFGIPLRISAVPKAHFQKWLCHLGDSAVRTNVRSFGYTIRNSGGVGT